MNETEINQEKVAITPTTTGSTKAVMSPQELTPISYEIAKSYEGMVKHFRRVYGLDQAEAFAKTEDLLDPATSHPDYAERLRNGPPQDADWWELTNLARNQPDAVPARWGAIKQAARDALASGHEAASVLEGPNNKPWERAQFLAIRHSFMEEWKPTSGIELALIDAMAQAQTIYFFWLKQLAIYMQCEVEDQKHKYDKEGYWLPPRMSSEAATEQAAAMADRFNRLFLRTLRQLRDLRRYAPQVTITNAGQVNIASGQQMNLAKIDAPEQSDLNLE